jgi:hypothetical protein
MKVWAVVKEEVVEAQEAVVTARTGRLSLYTVRMHRCRTRHRHRRSHCRLLGSRLLLHEPVPRQHSASYLSRVRLRTVVVDVTDTTVVDT